MPDNDIRLQDIETKISYQELLLEHLNEALTSQQRQLDSLKRQIDNILQMLKSPQNHINRPEDEAPPPHY
ncbi:MAG: hypothetical protein COS82_08430 [Zetaproteobacteria bacterium CG06_land_8_20_14_3_00_59_53]|nr:MAG: hypothetical protein AUK36_07520 [Zetaproteobacteria bacterium CG2_30_59_37]PIO88808.1 MAG: hypothetical protein COX56_11140 [Zetaproteobacteria bacterium CG23_combo_of_CG06-09_8_20_14_all_59_86]PIQ64530.1 MAG: hypothetical protein COV97_08830 [Zetaproteobacteria bacterium CG11_big_fil_rev_8_21_14_0_20_59_439]PIU70039.1 MAG: hypothetical protein COS82_08430 [Zetaproteobacteria bacterium CG06_land_8_20_14_3_00_59_53]PIU97996.1 MAG: hypothetical protein COS62_00875 [Zetaproteobacteria bac